MKVKALACFVLILTLFAAAHAQAAYTVGEYIADFTLNDAYGTPVSLHESEGLVIWLVFWTNT